jgi:hypothetical protein
MREREREGGFLTTSFLPLLVMKSRESICFIMLSMSISVEEEPPDGN